ncbi:MAG: DUF2878 domain-containing protein, partial [Steroidobacteraceae bacterium]
MSLWGNLLGYQLVWFVAVCGAGRSLAWPAVLAAALFAACQLVLSGERTLEVRLIIAAIVLGVLLDGTLATARLLHYAAPSPAVPAGGAPLWILALWAAFALTLNHSLKWLKGRYLLSALCGALGGPLAYAAAGRLAGAVTFDPPTWRATLW